MMLGQNRWIDPRVVRSTLERSAVHAGAEPPAINARARTTSSLELLDLEDV
jgi:hypothetical protein